MRIFLFALCLLLCGVVPAHADELRWYDCLKELSYLRYVPGNGRDLLEDVIDTKRATACVRVKIKERTMLIAALEPALGAKPFPREALRRRLQEVAGKRYVVAEQFHSSLQAPVYRGYARHEMHRRPTFVSAIEVEQGESNRPVKYRLVMSFYGSEVSDADIESSFTLLRHRLGFSCAMTLCRRPPE